MTITTRTRMTIGAAIASLALFAGAGGAAAATPSVSVSTEAGPLATELNSEVLRSEVAARAGGELAKANRRIRGAERKLAQARENLHRTLNRLETTTGDEARKLRRKVRRLRQRVRSLRRQVRRLRRQTIARIQRAQNRALARARSAGNGAWLVVSRSGRILEQSGGISVTHAGAGVYQLSFETGRSSCLRTALSGPTPLDIPLRVGVSPRGPEVSLVLFRLDDQARASGFYVTAVC